MGAGRPSFLAEARTVPVVLEGADVDEARRRGVNMSELCRSALARELGRRGKRDAAKKEDALGKFRGLPVHVVGRLRAAAMWNDYQLGKALETVNSCYGRGISADEARELVPKF